MPKFVLVLKRTAAQAERKVHDPQGVLGVADSYARKSNWEGQPRYCVPCFGQSGNWEGPGLQNICFLC